MRETFTEDLYWTLSKILPLHFSRKEEALRSIFKLHNEIVDFEITISRILFREICVGKNIKDKTVIINIFIFKYLDIRFIPYIS